MTGGANSGFGSINGKWLVLVASGLLCSVQAIFADDGDVFSPPALTADHFTDLKERSPFLRTLDFTEAYRLRGVATIDGQPVAVLFNRHTEKTVQVTSGRANALGMKLIAVDEAKNLANVSVRLAIGGEEVELAYDTRQISPQPTPKAKPRYDSRGRLQPPQRLVDKYRTMNDQQRKQYQTWRSAYLKKYPDQEHSMKRYEIGEKVVDAIKSGKGPPPVR